jgi:hypothetical protein
VPSVRLRVKQSVPSVWPRLEAVCVRQYVSCASRNSASRYRCARECPGESAPRLTFFKGLLLQQRKQFESVVNRAPFQARGYGRVLSVPSGVSSSNMESPQIFLDFSVFIGSREGSQRFLIPTYGARRAAKLVPLTGAVRAAHGKRVFM